MKYWSEISNAYNSKFLIKAGYNANWETLLKIKQ